MMSLKLLLLVCVMGLISTFCAQAEMTIRAACTQGCWDNAGQRSILRGVNFVISIYGNNDDYRVGLSMPFTITSTDTSLRIIWADTALFPTAQFRSFFLTFQTTYAESWDGNLSNVYCDTTDPPLVGDLYSFTGVSTAEGYPPGLGEIEIMRIAGRTSTTQHLPPSTFCVEQGNACNDMYDWLFDPPVPVFAKTCWEISLPPCDWPHFTNCPGTITAEAIDAASFQFTAHDLEQDPIKFRHYSGPGIIDSLTGLWNYTPTLADAWQIDTLKVYVTDYCFNVPLWGPYGNACISPVAVKGICGDADNNGAINILDVMKQINCIFVFPEGCIGQITPAFDANGNGTVNVMDMTHMINYLYRQGPAPLCPPWP